MSTLCRLTILLMGVCPLCNTCPWAVPATPSLLFERGKGEREKLGHQKVVCTEGLASPEALSGWKTLCTPEADSITSLWAPEAEPSPAGQFFMPNGFYKMQEEEQDSSSLSLQLGKKKKMPPFSEISSCLVPYKKDFCKTNKQTNHHLKDLFTLIMFRDFFF